MEKAKVCEIFKLLGNENRLSVMLSIMDNSGCVSEIVKKTQLSQSLVSQILKKFSYMDLIEKKIKGHKRFYCIKDKKFCTLLKEFINYVEKQN